MGNCKDGVCTVGPADNLEAMLEMQKALQDRLGSLTFTSELEKTNFIKAHAQYCDQELHEMLRELKYFKSWKKYPWTPEEEAQRLANAREEFIDSFHFILNIAIVLGLDSNSMFALYAKKNNINHERQDNNY